MTFNYNQANESGGGVHTLNSLIVIESTMIFQGSIALEKSGGGINVVDSSIEVGGRMQFISNQGMFGGGISFENSTVSSVPYNGTIVTETSFKSNQAIYGGAVFVNDESESHLCSNDPLYGSDNKCFVQVLLGELLISFNNNSAKFGGDNLYGGLLDRCKAIGENDLSIGQTAEMNLLEITTIRNLSTVSSQPVRVCLCNGSNIDCSRAIQYITVTRGNAFTIQLVAVDQVEHPVTATVVLSSDDSLELPESQRVQGIDATCSNVTYRVIFPNVSTQYTLSVYALGPCDNIGISSLNVSVHVQDCLCGIGFMQDFNSTRCSCVCDTQDELFSAYVKQCDQVSKLIL